jgi:nucleoid-associated protein YgaU
MSKEQQALQEANSSPDLTHTIEVKAGDTLPLLCYQVYKNAAYYPEVARINRLNNLHELRPGQRLTFPPLR